MFAISMLEKIRMQAGECAVVRVKRGPGRWTYGTWQDGDFSILPTEFGEKLAKSPLAVSMQAYTCSRVDQQFEAWVFVREDYDEAWQAMLVRMDDTPRCVAKVNGLSWWQRWFRLAF